jgi:hypothetical protein
MVREAARTERRRSGRYCGLAVLILVFLPGILAARGHALPRRPAPLPPVVSSVSDSLADAERGMDPWTVQVAGVVRLHPAVWMWAREGLRAVLDVPHSILRCGINRIALPPPVGA